MGGPIAIPAPEVVGDRSGRALLDVPSSSRRRRAGKSRVTDPTSSGDSSASCDETDEDAADSIAPDNYNSLSGGSPLLHGREYGSSSQAAMGFLPEAENDELLPHDPFFGTTAMEGDNTTFTFAVLGLSTEQYPSAPVEAYVLLWEQPLKVYSAFQVGDITGNDGGLHQTDYNPEPSALPPGRGSFDPYPADLPSSQRFYTEQPDFVRPSSPGMEERNSSSASNPPPLNDSGSPPLEVDALSGHGIEWPTGVQPGSFPMGDDFFDLLLGRVRAVVRAENPPSIEAVKRALE
ncbi:hypothetical protein Taro_012398 [Colocasia esculenta]|uniref:Uncharacterized protein n=1 Tax=Colocasia esculenta TaxID=4460 RepID=A0A843UDE9_COLES|nr:hypothetical protein [Colocasia esculenta]